MYFFQDLATNLKKKRDRVFINCIRGKNVEMLFIKLEPGESTFHSHSNEQMGYILSGEAEISIDGEIQICRAGDGYYIPCNVQHGFKVLNNNCLEYIEVFSPPKDENR
jgi:mannose-6-phosphate isomerase-like protein (cupin superfamily)